MLRKVVTASLQSISAVVPCRPWIFVSTSIQRPVSRTFTATASRKTRSSKCSRGQAKITRDAKARGSRSADARWALPSCHLRTGPDSQQRIRRHGLRAHRQTSNRVPTPTQKKTNSMTQNKFPLAGMKHGFEASLRTTRGKPRTRRSPKTKPPPKAPRKRL